MRLTEAISRIADFARQHRMPLPHILMPRWALLQLRICIENDMGGPGSVYGLKNLDGPIQFDGVTFARMTIKPRIRVKAGRRVISMAHYFMHGMQWRPAEIDLLMTAISDMNRV